LLVRWHETHSKRPPHLVRVELLMHLTLERCVITILFVTVSNHHFVVEHVNIPVATTAVDRRVCATRNMMRVTLR
jgi:hypothetical protein